MFLQTTALRNGLASLVALMRYSILLILFVVLIGIPRQTKAVLNDAPKPASGRAATRDGFVIGNGDGILGVVSGAASISRAFATDMIAINTIAVSSDGKLIAVGNAFGNVELWELR
jgi:hypothetical protein